MGPVVGTEVNQPMTMLTVEQQQEQKDLIEHERQQMRRDVLVDEIETVARTLAQELRRKIHDEVSKRAGVGGYGGDYIRFANLSERDYFVDGLRTAVMRDLNRTIA